MMAASRTRLRSCDHRADLAVRGPGGAQAGRQSSVHRTSVCRTPPIGRSRNLPRPYMPESSKAQSERDSLVCRSSAFQLNVAVQEAVAGSEPPTGGAGKRLPRPLTRGTPTGRDEYDGELARLAIGLASSNSLACYRLLPPQSLSESSRVPSCPLIGHRPSEERPLGRWGNRLGRSALRASVEKLVSRGRRPSPYHLAMPPQRTAGPRVIAQVWARIQHRRVQKTFEALQRAPRVA